MFLLVPASEAQPLSDLFSVLGAHGRLPTDQAGVGRLDAPQAETAKVAEGHLEISGVLPYSITPW